MRFKSKKGLIASSLALALTSIGTAHAADAIQFDLDGAGGVAPVTIGAFDWSVSSAFADNVHTSPGSFDLYFHAALGGLKNPLGNDVPAASLGGLNSTFEITVVGGFRESLVASPPSAATFFSNGSNAAPGGGDDIYQISQTATFGIPPGGGTNFISVYFDNFTGGSLQSDALSGKGYADGTQILTALLSGLTGAFTSTQRFIDVDNSTTFTAGDIPIGSGLLDGVTPDDWAGLMTVFGNGSTSLNATITSFDPTFFLTAITGLVQTLDFTTETKLPFSQTNPSKCFDINTSGGSVCWPSAAFDLGTINGGFLGGEGPDLLLQADASNSFIRAAVPEPNVLGLLGAGLVGLALSRRRFGS